MDFRKLNQVFARFSLFTIYFWFGILKITGDSPANPMVAQLQEKTIPFLTFDTFIFYFALFEMFIGILFLFPKFTRIAAGVFALHMFMVFGPMVLLPEMTWDKFLVPTLEGQYIIKNFALISLVLFLISKDQDSHEIS